MNLVTKTSHKITFSVQYFEEREGGMDMGGFGNSCEDIGHAIEQLRLAKISVTDVDWIITCDVKTTIDSYDPTKDKTK